ncbi:ERV/ALR sulfhydryl oxidase domain-containing protein [Dichotomocladium elegans]|nr:ERV/ALR sulfhydryl oxidase domain-containing protein [Dichotomocladium elegans]
MEPTAPLYDGHVISAKMNNATIKAELGRSSWKLLHTMAAQYPEDPTENERKALDQFIRLFSRLYPCGECAAHFQLLLKDYPPQTSSRVAASQWLCAVHNKVNERLHKPIFDCADIQEKYHCGCEEEEEDNHDPTTSMLLNIPGLSG